MSEAGHSRRWLTRDDMSLLGDTFGSAFSRTGGFYLLSFERGAKLKDVIRKRRPALAAVTTIAAISLSMNMLHLVDTGPPKETAQSPPSTAVVVSSDTPTHDPEAAIANANAAISKNPNQAGAYTYRASLYLARGDLDRAIADFTTAARLAPNLYETFVLRGDAFVAKGDLDRAITDYQQAVRLNGNDLPTIVKLAKLHRDYARFDTSAFYYQHALAVLERSGDGKSPTVGDILAGLATVKQEAGDAAAAIEQYRRAVAVYEQSGRDGVLDSYTSRSLAYAHAGLGDTLGVSGDLAGARDQYRKALAIHERLAAVIPNDRELQLDVVAAQRRLALSGDDPARRWLEIVATLRRLNEHRALDFTHAAWLAEAERRTATATIPILE